jgi:hypothetical protein
MNTYLEYTRECRFSEMASIILPEELVGLKEVMAEAADIAPDSGASDQIQAMFGDSIQSAMDIRRMENADFFERLMELIIATVPDLENMLRSAEGVYLGSVCESDSKAYAVTKVTIDMFGETVESVDVIPLARVADGTWKIGLKADLKAIARAIADM